MTDQLVKVIGVAPLGGYRLSLAFSDRSAGERDLADVVADGGPMAEPLADKAFFARAFLQLGVPIWPNGFALDPTALWEEMKGAGLLRNPTRGVSPEIIDVVRAEPLGGYRLFLRFSDDNEGERDFKAMIDEGGPMVEPLRDPAYFARVFVDMGAPTWPNGYDLAPDALYKDMLDSHELHRFEAA